MNSRASQAAKEKCLRWLQNVPPPQELTRHVATKSISDHLLTLEDIEHEGDQLYITHSPRLDHKTLTYPPDRYSRVHRRNENSLCEPKLHIHEPTSHLHVKPSQSQIRSKSQSNKTFSAFKSPSSLSVNPRRRTLSDYGSSPVCSRRRDHCSVGSLPNVITVGATDRVRLPFIDSSSSLSLTSRQKHNHAKQVLTKPAISTSLLQHREIKPTDSWWRKDLHIEGFPMTVEHRSHSQEQQLSIRRNFPRKRKGSLVVGVRSFDSSAPEQNSDKIIKPSLLII